MSAFRTVGVLLALLAPTGAFSPLPVRISSVVSPPVHQSWSVRLMLSEKEAAGGVSPVLPSSTEKTLLMMSERATEVVVPSVLSSSEAPVVEATQRVEFNKAAGLVLLAALGASAVAAFGHLDGMLTVSQQHILTSWTDSAMKVSTDLWESYSRTLDAHPIRTKALTSAIVYTIGDIISQRFATTENDDSAIDVPRVMRSMLAGLIGHGPMSHVWYNLSENLFEYMHWTEWWSIVPKVAVDQTLWGPLWNNTYILLLGLMKLESFESIWSDVKQTTIPLIISGLKLWPLCHCITYGVVPVENRLLWVDLVEIVWVMILATQAAEVGSAHGSATVHAETSEDDASLEPAVEISR